MRRFVQVALLVGWFAAVASGPALAGQQRPRLDPLIENTDDPVVLQRYGVEFYRQDRPQEALAALSKAARLYPGNAETYMWLGVVYTRLGRLEAAEQEFERALAINPDLTEARNWYGLYWVRRGDLERAIQQYRIALQDPAYPRISRARVQLNLGNALMQLGRYEEAVAPLAEATQAPIPANDGAYLWIRVALAESLIRTGRAQEALAVLAQLDALPDTARVELLRGLAYRDLGEVDHARERLERVLLLEPGSELARRALELLRELDALEQGSA